MPTTDRSRTRRVIGGTLLVALVSTGGYLGVKGLVNNFGSPGCRAVVAGNEVSFSPEQMANAATIAGVSVKRGLPARAATIAITTAIQESKLRNLTYGDRDSLGLFQQRPSQGWGTTAQVQDAVHSSGTFYDALVKIQGYENKSITKVAQQVQRSGYPEAYADHEGEGRVLASVFTGQSPAGIGCRLNEATTGAPAAKLAKAIQRESGLAATPSGRQVTVSAPTPTAAWSAGSWAVAHADAEGITVVTVGSQTWTRSRDSSAWSWHAATRPAASARSVRIEIAG